MLDLTNSRLRMDSSLMLDTDPDVTSVEEGALLAQTIKNSKAVVGPSTGAANETIRGFAVSSAGNVTSAPTVEEITAPTGGGTVTLKRTPVDGSVNIVFKDHNGPTTTAPTVAGKEVTFAADDADRAAYAVYRYEPTVSEAAILFGEAYSNGAGAAIGRTGCITGAEVLLVSNFDPAADWWDDAANANLKAGPNGTVTQTGSGAALPMVTVMAPPSAGSPFLALSVRF